MRKLGKNKFVVLAICTIVVSIVYFIVQKAIDNYAFKSNSDIVTIEENLSKAEKSQDADVEDILEKEISSEETDLLVEEVETEEIETESSAEVEVVEIQNKIYVYITGEVNNPGVVILNEGSRIVDAINAAGGTTAKANVSKVNLVYVLDDGMKVNIPNDTDLKNNSDFEYITMNSGDGGKADYLGNDSSTSSSSNTGSGSSANGSSDSGKKYSVVNINTATQTELETLPGIGPSLALKIINYRKENGKFSSIEEIKEVSGIGDSKFEDLKNYITI